MFSFFFYDLYNIPEIQQAFKNICLDKMLADGWFDMSVYIYTRFTKNEIFQKLKQSKSKYVVLYEKAYPSEDNASSIWKRYLKGNHLDFEIVELTILESQAIVNWVYSAFKKVDERIEFTVALLKQIKTFHKIRNHIEFSEGVVYNNEMVEIHFVSSLDEFIKKVPPSDKTGRQMFFRGHSSSNYILIPSIMRTKSWEISEFSMYNELLICCPREFENCRTHLEKLVKMQHYGLPTRLLDITRNPLVALYFACCDQQECYGEVVLLSVNHDEIKYPQSDTVTILASLPQIASELKNTYRTLANDAGMDNTTFNTHLSRLVQEIRQEKPAFIPEIRKEDLVNSFIVYALKSNERIIKQDGAFIICGLLKHLNSLNRFKYKNDAKTMVLLVDKKEKILKQLSDIGVNFASLFPEIECVSEHIKKRFS